MKPIAMLSNSANFAMCLRSICFRVMSVKVGRSGNLVDVYIGSLA